MLNNSMAGRVLPGQKSAARVCGEQVRLRSETWKLKNGDERTTGPRCLSGVSTLRPSLLHNLVKVSKRFGSFSTIEITPFEQFHVLNKSDLLR